MVRGMFGRCISVSLVLAGALIFSAACAPAAPPPPTAAVGAAKPAAPPAKAAGPVVELRAGSGFAQGEITTRGLDKFAELVGEKSKGELVVRVFYQSLGAEAQLAESVMAGSVDMGLLSNGNAGRFTSAYFLYDLPFIFKDNDSMLKVINGAVGRQLTEVFEKDLGVKSLFKATTRIGRDVQTRSKQVKTPADIKGLKIRVLATPVDLATFKAWGANPTPVDWGQTVTALQQGVVDGMAVAPSFLLSSKSYEAVKYSVGIGYQQVIEEVYINAKKFASLSAEHQRIMVEAAREASLWQYDEGARMVASDLQELTKLGVVLYKPTPEEYGQWTSFREKIWQEVAEQLKDKIDLNLAKQVYQAQ